MKIRYQEVTRRMQGLRSIDNFTAGGRRRGILN